MIPLEDISAQNALMVADEGDPADIRRHAEEWITANRAVVDRWIRTADPDAAGLDDPEEDEEAEGGVLRVAVRPLPPFVIYENRAYSGFEVDLVRFLAARLGMRVEIHTVDTVAKQIDDVNRGAARLALGGVAITASREEIVDFTLPVLDTGLTIMAPVRASRSIGDRITGFFRAVASSDLPWLLVVFGAAVLVAAHLVWWLERRHNPDFAGPYLKGIWDSFYWSVVTMSTVGYGDKVTRGVKGRVVALIWIALGTLVFASFTASIASSLAVNELRSGIAGPSDLPGHRVAAVEGSAGDAYLSTVGVGPVLVDDIRRSLWPAGAGRGGRHRVRRPGAALPLLPPGRRRGYDGRPALREGPVRAAPRRGRRRSAGADQPGPPGFDRERRLRAAPRPMVRRLLTRRMVNHQTVGHPAKNRAEQVPEAAVLFLQYRFLLAYWHLLPIPKASSDLLLSAPPISLP